MLVKLRDNNESSFEKPKNKEPTTFSSRELIAKQLLFIAENGNNLDSFKLGSSESCDIENFLMKCSHIINQRDIQWKPSLTTHEDSAKLSVSDVSITLPPEAPTESLNTMLEIFFSKELI